MRASIKAYILLVLMAASSAALAAAPEPIKGQAVAAVGADKTQGFYYVVFPAGFWGGLCDLDNWGDVEAYVEVNKAQYATALAAKATGRTVDVMVEDNVSVHLLGVNNIVCQAHWLVLN